MEPTETLSYDAADFLDTIEKVTAFLDEALTSDDPAYIAHALGVAARARGMSQIARDTGLSLESLYRSLSKDGNPELATLIRVMRALGVRLSAAPA